MGGCGSSSVRVHIDSGMPIVAALLWILPPSAIVAGFVVVHRAQRARSAMRNACATALFAAGLVLGVFYFEGWHELGPGAIDPADGWQWRVPCFAMAAALYASLGGWSATILWLSMRRIARPTHLLPPVPRRWELVLAALLLPLLAAIFVALIGWLAQLTHPV